MYKFLKNMVLHLVGPENLRKMISEVEAVATTRLRQWSCLESVELKDETASVITLKSLEPNLFVHSPCLFDTDFCCSCR